MNSLQERYLDELIKKYASRLEWLEGEISKSEDRTERSVYKGMRIGAQDALEDLKQLKTYGE